MRRRTRLLLLLVVSAATVTVVTVSNAPADRKQPEEKTKDPKTPDKAPQPIGPKLDKALTGLDEVFRAADKPDKPGKPRKLLTPAEAQRMAVLMDIWKRQGGDIFSGTIFENPGAGAVEEEFAEALRRVMTKARAENQSKLPADPSPPESIFPEPPETTSAGLVESLQNSCRLLDAKANDLEMQ